MWTRRGVASINPIVSGSNPCVLFSFQSMLSSWDKVWVVSTVNNRFVWCVLAFGDRFDTCIVSFKAGFCIQGRVSTEDVLGISTSEHVIQGGSTGPSRQGNVSTGNRFHNHINIGIVWNRKLTKAAKKIWAIWGAGTTEGYKSITSTRDGRLLRPVLCTSSLYLSPVNTLWLYFFETTTTKNCAP